MCVLAFIVSALMIAALVSPWYFHFQEYNMTTGAVTSGTITTPGNSAVVNSTKAYYDLDGVNIVSSAGSIKSSVFSKYGTTSGSVRNTVKVAQAFTLIALLLGFITMTLVFIFFFERVRNKIIFAIGMTATRLVVVVFSSLILISIIIAFLNFLGITSSFKSDNDNCYEGPCRKFVDSVTSDFNNGMKFENSWGPSAGWYIMIGALPVAFFLVLVLVINKFPLPIDSEASSGEAL